jgi:hypothetical protein
MARLIAALPLLPKLTAGAARSSPPLLDAFDASAL